MFKNKSKKFATILPFIGLLLFVLISYNSHSQPLRSVTYNVSTAEIVIPGVSLEFPYGITVGGDNVATSSDLIDAQTSLYDSISQLDIDVPKFGETNALTIAFSDLNIEGPVGYKRTILTGLTPQLNWESHVTVWYYPTDDFTPSQTGTKKPSQKMNWNIINTNSFNIQASLSGLGWDWQNIVETIPTNSWVSITAEYDPDPG